MPPVPSPAESRDEETNSAGGAPAARKILKLDADPTKIENAPASTTIDIRGLRPDARGNRWPRLAVRVRPAQQIFNGGGNVGDRRILHLPGEVQFVSRPVVLIASR